MAKLEQLTLEVALVLKVAQLLGKVVIVTNSTRPWVTSSCEAYMPQLMDILGEFPVIYAQEKIPAIKQKLQADREGFFARYTRNNKHGDLTLDEELECVWTAIKSQAMEEAVSSFYTKYENQSWKNLISIGDGRFEHRALKEVASFTE